MNATAAARLATLYSRYSARLAAHVAERLVAAGVDVDQVDDVTQEVWLWAAQQRRLPEWEGLAVMTTWVIEAGAEERARPEIAVGLRPVGAPVVPFVELSSVVRLPRSAGRPDLLPLAS